jgi:hypothetical protein
MEGPGVETAVSCIHWWVIESPEGSKSKGVCKLCGEEREFSNYQYLGRNPNDNLIPRLKSVRHEYPDW